MGGSTGRSSSRCFEDPGIGRWDCISAKGTGTVDEEERGVLENRGNNYLWPRFLLVMMGQLGAFLLVESVKA